MLIHFRLSSTPRTPPVVSTPVSTSVSTQVSTPVFVSTMSFVSTTRSTTWSTTRSTTASTTRSTTASTEPQNFDSFVSTCYDESVLNNQMFRSKRDYDEKLLMKAESLTNLVDIVNLYHSSHVLWSDKLVQKVESTENILLEQFKLMKADSDAKFDRLQTLAETTFDRVNQTITVKEQRFYFADFFNLFKSMFMDVEVRDGITFGHIVEESTPWSSIVAVLLGILGWLDARGASRMAKYYGVKLAPYQKV